jgi:hypothetical protein
MTLPRSRIAGHALHCELAAYHEAAHAVVALHCGRVVREVCILPRSPGDGWVQYETWFPEAPKTRNPRDKLLYWTYVLSEAEREVKIRLAGPLAEAKLLRTPLRSLGARSDLEWALAAQTYLDKLRESLRDTIFIPDEQTSRFLERLRRQTRCLIARSWCWNAVTVLAQDLMGWHRLSGHDVAETVQWSMKPHLQMSLGLGIGGQAGAASDGRQRPRCGCRAPRSAHWRRLRSRMSSQTDGEAFLPDNRGEVHIDTDSDRSR